MSDKEIRYLSVLQEEMRDDIKILTEAVSALLVIPAKVESIEVRLGNIEDTLGAMKVLLKNHDTRISKLESA